MQDVNVKVRIKWMAECHLIAGGATRHKRTHNEQARTVNGQRRRGNEQSASNVKCAETEDDPPPGLGNEGPKKRWMSGRKQHGPKQQGIPSHG